MFAAATFVAGWWEPSVNRELAQKPHKPHAAFWHCAKPHAEIRPEVTEKPRREKCAKSEWSRSDGWTNCFPSSRIDQIQTEEKPDNFAQCRKAACGWCGFCASSLMLAPRAKFIRSVTSNAVNAEGLLGAVPAGKSTPRPGGQLPR
ncbi:hypothetical protein DFH09DRAFT_1086379 [Mycena vulgaris]|nr:hypothetical protein DFH09DRAFT_1112742 [Mycena vulgaris]KAJ6551063.1 hypothetical protein DFH09DRAFT_1086379 [Mycena vulgaris]